MSDFAAKPNQTVIEVLWTEPNDGRGELCEELMWQDELPQLAKEIKPLLGLFINGVNQCDHPTSGPERWSW